MELLLETQKAEKAHHIIDELLFSKQNVIKTIGRDFNKSVANILGLVTLLDDSETSDQDLKIIQHYLSLEAKKLNVLVKDICS